MSFFRPLMESVRQAFLFVAHALWRWDVIGITSPALFALGVGAIYGDDYWVAAGLCFVSVLWLTAKTLASDEVRNHERRSGVRVSILLAGLVIFGFSLIWINHRSNVIAAKMVLETLDVRRILGVFTPKPPTFALDRSSPVLVFIPRAVNHPPKSSSTEPEKTPEKAKLEFTFFTIYPDALPILELNAPVIDGAVSIDITTVCLGDVPAKNGYLIVTICNSCKYAEEPQNMVAPTDPFGSRLTRERHFDELYPGTISGEIKLKIIPPPPPFDPFFMVGGHYVCDNCPPYDPKNPQLLRVNFTRSP